MKDEGRHLSFSYRKQDMTPLTSCLHGRDASEKSLYRLAPDLIERRRNHRVVCGQLSVDVDTNHRN